jgi:hypothetical protein
LLTLRVSTVLKYPLTTSLDRLLNIGNQIFRLLQADRYSRVAHGNAAVLFLAAARDPREGVAQAIGIEDQLDVPAQAPVDGILFLRVIRT